MQRVCQCWPNSNRIEAARLLFVKLQNMTFDCNSFSRPRVVVNTECPKNIYTLSLIVTNANNDGILHFTGIGVQ
jgi:hypothetical protein